MQNGNGQLNLSSLRLKLESAQGKRYWRSLEEIADTPEFREMLYREFPQQASEWVGEGGDGFSRRNFLKVMGASLALAGAMEGCTRAPTERIVPYVRPPANLVPGKPLFFASAMPFRGVGQGVVVTSREGRPIKVEGNPDHPESLGATNVFMQASILGMYDPDRSKVVVQKGDVSSWSAFAAALKPVMAQKRENKGAGLRILTESLTGPALIAQMGDFVKSFPEAKWHRYEPVSRDAVTGGTKLALGKRLEPVYAIEKADVILSLDGDFLFAEPGSLRYSRKFIDRRRIRTIGEDGKPQDVKAITMNRLYVAESSPTITGAMADHRLTLRAGEIGLLAAAIAKEVGAGVDASAGNLPAAAATWAAKVAKDLAAHKGTCVVIAGDGQPAEVHALAAAINVALGNVGKTVSYIEPLDPHPEDSAASLATLVADMNAGKVDTLIILGANPVYTAPADLEFAKALEKVALRIHLGLYQDETGFLCHWHLPEAHYLEAWGDVRAFDGTVSIVQPLIAPLYQGKSASEVLSMMMGQPDVSGYEVVRRYWAGQHGSGDFEAWWKAVLEKGIVEGSAAKAQAASLRGRPKVELAAVTGTELIFRPDPAVWDGRFANNGWLQELPKPMNHLTWDNAAFVSVKTAEKHGLQNGDIVTLTSGGRKLGAAAWIAPGHADDAVTLTLGYGRTRAGRVGGMDKSVKLNPVGFNAYALRTSQRPLFASDLQISKTGETYKFAPAHIHQSIEERSLGDLMRPEVVGRPQEHHDHEHDHEHAHDHGYDREAAEREIANRKLVRVATLEQFKADPRFAQKMDEEEAAEPVSTAEKTTESTGGKRTQLQLFPEWDYTDKEKTGLKHRWAMSIDTHACIGCNACVIGCQAENNIPVVGKDQVSRGREMHWIRIDTYFAESLDNPETYFEPIPCMHCENAPCELVCPVNATVHDDEGINNMVYNRCVGTRYCSNNCPYKVRHFNFLQYTDETTESLKLMRNPEVTVRSRGVMEKCTYCVQRLNNTRIEIEKLVVRLEEQWKQSKDEADRGRIKQRLDEGRKRLLDNIETACQQACPTEAIVFGDLNDPTSRIARVKTEPLDFELLGELTTKPRTTYLARVRNPNPEMA
jgi:molybdopterin-containing oxidoreductase family iron-sulfur binding subunit